MNAHHSVHIKLLSGNSRDMLALEYLTELCRERGCSAKHIITEALIYYGRSINNIDRLTSDEKALAEKFGKSIVDTVKAELTRIIPIIVPSTAPGQPNRQTVSAADDEPAKTDGSIDLSVVDWDFLGLGSG